MSVINTNITSMIGQSNLQKSQNALQTSMERLSSGLRINSAKDDAAGQAIANRMSAQITGLSTAQRNANDGISVAQTAEGALNQVNDNLQRIRELSVQAQNGTNSSNDLKSIQDEIDQRLGEIDRISKQTDFNGVKVLAADNNLKIQVGANDNESIVVGLEEINRSTLGLNGFRVDGDKAATLADLLSMGGTGTKTLSLGAVDYSVAVSNGESGAVTASGVAVFKGAGDGALIANASGASNVLVSLATNSADAVAFATAAATAQAGGHSSFDWNGTTWQGTADDTFGNGTFTANFNGEAVQIVVTGSDNTSGNDAALAVTVDGSVAGIYKQIGSEATVLTTSATNAAATEADLKNEGAAVSAATLTVGTTTYGVDAANVVTSGGERTYVSNAGTASASLVAASAAKLSTPNPLAALDTALNKVDTLRSSLGAIQNRFESAITNLQTNETNLSAARSRIEDADYAVEVANMTRAQILQQAGTSVLAQANQIPQNVLSLLG